MSSTSAWTARKAEANERRSAQWLRLQDVLGDPGASEGAIHAALQERVSGSAAAHGHVAQGLLYGALADAAAAPRLFGYLTSVTRDGYAAAAAALKDLVVQKWPKLLEAARVQAVWVFRQLVGLAVADAEALALAMLRQVAGGDLSAANVWLASQLLEVFQSNLAWLLDLPALATTALFAYLRLLPDHAAAKHEQRLRQSEAAFCCHLLREHFQDCLAIGRDLIRLLQDVAGLPEFEPIWRDLLCNAATFQATAPSLSGLEQLYATRTPVRYVVSRVTPDAETQLIFMLTHVRMGNQRRYQTWFAQRFLSTPESESLVSDLIRYICCAHHPPNAILQSDIVPRWAIVGWLLKCVKSGHVEANAKLALFFDWLFFGASDNIMNIEPAILLMVYSIPKYVDLTHTLLEFLFLLVEHFDPPRRELIERGVASSIDILISKGVVRSLEPLYANPLVHPELREKLQAAFPAHCRPELGPRPAAPLPTLAQGESRPPDTGVARLLVDASTSTPGEHVKSPRNAGPQSTPTEGNMDTNGPLEKAAAVPEAPSVSLAGSLKRKRQLSTDNEAADLHERLDRLAKAMAGSQQGVIDALVQLLELVVAAPRLAGVDRQQPRMAVGHEDTRSNGRKYHVPESSPLYAPDVAKQMEEVFSKAGYQVCAPLRSLPTEMPDGDEIMSVTSTLFRLFVATRNSQLRQLLATWQQQGIAVSTRLLCYVARVAEELEQTSKRELVTRVEVPDSAEQLEQPGKGAVQDEPAGLPAVAQASPSPPVKTESEVDRAAATTAERLASGSTAGTSSSSPRGEEKQPRLAEELLEEVRDGGALSDMHRRGRAAVADAFWAYEEFLRDVGKRKGATAAATSAAAVREGESKSEAAAGSSAGDSKAAGVPELPSLQQLLLTDLGTCLLWNTYRLLQVLPAVFKYLPHLTMCNEEVVHLLLSALDPLELCRLLCRVDVGDVAIVGSGSKDVDMARLVKGSLAWESLEQQWFWQLLAAEVQRWPLPALLRLLTTVIAAIRPQVDSEAVVGFMSLLRCRAPAPQLLELVLGLPPSFDQVPAAMLSIWSSSHRALLVTLLQQHQSAKGKTSAAAEPVQKDGEHEHLPNGVWSANSDRKRSPVEDTVVESAPVKQEPSEHLLGGAGSPPAGGPSGMQRLDPAKEHTELGGDGNSLAEAQRDRS
eukprot:SM000023S07703  [mRNA]  locus=s23:946106:951441:- [translate_table: standard]